MKRLMVAVFVAVAAVIALGLSATGRQVAFQLVFGRASYLGQVLPRTTVRWDGVAAFLIGLVVFAALLHFIARWLRREMGDPNARWRWRSTWMVVGLLLMMFVAGIAIVGAVHQTIWLAKEDDHLLAPALADDSAFYNRFLRKQLGLAILNFSDVHRRLPTRTPVRPGQAEHSWITYILPYANYESAIDLQKPWDHADNQAEIRKLVPAVLNSELLPVVLRNKDGYGVSHYAGNTHVFDYSGPFSLKDIKDGTSNTLLVGEVVTEFQPWAKPRANRDPALGINRSPKGFGGPAANGGAAFVMADGSVRFFSSDVDPAVLKALGTPAGNEAVDVR